MKNTGAHGAVKPFHGWLMVLWLGLVLGVTHGIANNCFSLFMIPVTTSLSIPRQSFSACSTVVNILFMIVSLLSGGIYKKVNVLTTMRIAGFMLPTAFFCYSLANNVWMLYAAAVITGISLGFLTFLPATYILSQWFIHKRGLAVGLAFMGTGLMGMVMSPIGAIWIESFGWRWTFRAYAVVMAVVILPSVFFLLRARPSDMGEEPLQDSTAPAAEAAIYGPTMQQALRSRDFPVQMFMALAIGMVTTMLSGTMVPRLTDLGFSAIYAANMYSAYMGLMAVMKVVLGVLNDRIGIRACTAGALICCIITLLCFIFGGMQWLHIPMIPAIAIGCAAATILYPFLARYSFGSRAYTELYGMISAANSLWTSLGHLMQNGIYDATGSYNGAYIIGIVLSLLGLLLLPLMRKAVPEEK